MIIVTLIKFPLMERSYHHEHTHASVQSVGICIAGVQRCARFYGRLLPLCASSLSCRICPVDACSLMGCTCNRFSLYLTLLEASVIEGGPLVPGRSCEVPDSAAFLLKNLNFALRNLNFFVDFRLSGERRSRSNYCSTPGVPGTPRVAFLWPGK